MESIVKTFTTNLVMNNGNKIPQLGFGTHQITN